MFKRKLAWVWARGVTPKFSGPPTIPLTTKVSKFKFTTQLGFGEYKLSLSKNGSGMHYWSTPKFVACAYAAICICNMQNSPNFFDCVINFWKQKHWMPITVCLLFNTQHLSLFCINNTYWRHSSSVQALILLHVKTHLKRIYNTICTIWTLDVCL